MDPPQRCGSYRGGHEIHYIQARLSWEAPPIGRGVATVEPDGWITIVLDDESAAAPLRRWTHDPRRLAQLLGPVSGRVTLREQGVLAVASGDDGIPLVCVTGEPSSCPAPDESTAAGRSKSSPSGVVAR